MPKQVVYIMNRKGKLYLLPSPLASFDSQRWSAESVALEVPAAALSLYASLEYFIVESEKSALRLLSRFKNTHSMATLRLAVFDEHAKATEIAGLLDPLEEGQDGGILSEAGLPCVADPGGLLVFHAHRRGIEVIPVSGPSSLMLSLSASGLDAQRFMFLGYLPGDNRDREKALRRIGPECLRDGMTRLFIETPYRNDKLLMDCALCLPDNLNLCVAADIGGPRMSIWTKEVSQLRKLAQDPSSFPKIGKVPAVFVLGRAAEIRPRNTI